MVSFLRVRFEICTNIDADLTTIQVLRLSKTTVAIPSKVKKYHLLLGVIPADGPNPKVSLFVHCMHIGRVEIVICPVQD